MQTTVVLSGFKAYLLKFGMFNLGVLMGLLILGEWIWFENFVGLGSCCARPWWHVLYNEHVYLYTPRYLVLSGGGWFVMSLTEALWLQRVMAREPGAMPPVRFRLWGAVFLKNSAALWALIAGIALPTAKIVYALLAFVVPFVALGFRSVKVEISPSVSLKTAVKAGLLLLIGLPILGMALLLIWITFLEI